MSRTILSRALLGLSAACLLAAFAAVPAEGSGRTLGESELAAAVGGTQGSCCRPEPYCQDVNSPPPNGCMDDSDPDDPHNVYGCEWVWQEKRNGGAFTCGSGQPMGNQPCQPSGTKYCAVAESCMIYYNSDEQYYYCGQAGTTRHQVNYCVYTPQNGCYL